MSFGQYFLPLICDFHLPKIRRQNRNFCLNLAHTPCHLKVTYINREKEETIDNYLKQVQNLLEIVSDYQVDLFLPHKLEAKYWAFLGKFS